MSNDPWWRSWTVEELSPLNPAAVVAMQVAPPEDWQMRGDPSLDTPPSHLLQLFWLCWYARPDLRERQLHWQFSAWPGSSIHPDTIAEWSEPPRWKSTRLRKREWHLRALTLQSYALEVERCQRIHPKTWTPNSLGFQASLSEEHGNVLLAQIQRLDAAALGGCIVAYARRGRGFTGACGGYLRERMKDIKWSYRLELATMSV